MAAIRCESMQHECMSKKLQRVVLFALLSCSIICLSNAAIDIDTVTGCLPREYKYNATKTVVSKGQMISCWDIVKVYSCWGRCESYEFGDYKIPYKISYHPVCTYTGKVSRQVKLRHCHPEFTDPSYKVFDATGCACKVCDTDETSCENLNG